MTPTRDLGQHDETRGRVREPELSVDARLLRRAKGAERDAAVDALWRAAARTGFFYLTHAFEDPGVVDAVLSQARRFFALDDEDPKKRAVDNRNKPGSYGWMPLYGEPAYQPGTIAHVESFDCGREQAEELDKTLEGRNAWPALPGFRRELMAFWGAAGGVADAVLDALSDAAGLEPGFLRRRCSSRELNTMRVLRYPGGVAPPGDEHVGISAHTDFECVSLLLQTAPGLELRDASGDWYDAPSHDGRVAVLLGDMLERWTNGELRATGHRVRVTAEERMSIVVFFAVDREELVRPLPRFVTPQRPARYEAVRQREHIDAELRRAARNRPIEPGPRP